MNKELHAISVAINLRYWKGNHSCLFCQNGLADVGSSAHCSKHDDYRDKDDLCIDYKPPDIRWKEVLEIHGPNRG